MRNVLLVAGALGSLGAAQQTLVVPAAYDAVEGPAVAGIAGFTQARTMQVLIDARHLAAMQGASITALAFRRDGQFAEALAAGRCELVVRLAAATRAAVEPLPELARNRAAPIEVFRGEVDLPAAPAVSGAAPWRAPFAVAIALTAPFAYAGGDLCVEIEGSPTAEAPAPFWPVDAVSDGVRGDVQRLGTACGPFVGRDRRNHTTAASDLVVGRTARFVSRGLAGATGFLSIALAPLPVPIDLTAIGAPGCFAYVSGIAVIAARYGPALAAEFGGAANAVVHIPNDAALLGASFASQWLDPGPPLATSNALVCRLAAAVPTLGMATVLAERGAASGRVDTTAAPVVRFSFR
jgi:hypothetical protein